MIQDADFEYDPDDVPSLLEPLIQGKADVVYGSRFKKNAVQIHRTYHYFVNRFLTLVSNLLSGIYLTDMETCYKIFRADLLKAMRLRSKRFGIEVELTAYVAKVRARIFELPIGYFPRTRLQGKKINWKDGVAALVHLVRFNLFTSLDDAYENLPPKYLAHPYQS
jgi:glycosyltransferase involved in cell wall biosynthesis